MSGAGAGACTQMPVPGLCRSAYGPLSRVRQGGSPRLSRFRPRAYFFDMAEHRLTRAQTKTLLDEMVWEELEKFARQRMVILGLRTL